MSPCWISWALIVLIVHPVLVPLNGSSVPRHTDCILHFSVVTLDNDFVSASRSLIKLLCRVSQTDYIQMYLDSSWWKPWKCCTALCGLTHLDLSKLHLQSIFKCRYMSSETERFSSGFTYGHLVSLLSLTFKFSWSFQLVYSRLLVLF